MKSFTLMVTHLFLPVVDVVFDCIAGRWGLQCAQICGNCEGGPEFCQVYDGYCMNGCASGYKGVYCKERCENGFRGQYCKYECGYCLGSDPCNPDTGKCPLGCQTGYQLPYCQFPCEFDKWGDGCSKPCQCTDTTTTSSCGCNFVTGHCEQCGVKTLRYFPVKEPKCLNQHILSGGVVEYEPPNILDFPYKPVLAMVSVIAMFICGNFLWCPAPAEEPVVFEREKKIPRHLRKKIKYKSTLADLLRKKLAGQKGLK